MGKLTTRRAKATADVAVVDVSQSPSVLGVRTRSKTLADACNYLELRSRRLVKTFVQQHKNRNSRSLRCGNELDDNDTVKGSRTIPETTPRISIKESIVARSSSPDQIVQNALLVNATYARDLEEFFAREEQSQQHVFTEKYNFDFANELPLSGRYEWVKV